MQNLSTVDVVDLTDDTVSAVVPLGDRVALGVAVDTSTHAAYVGYTNWAHTMRLDVITQAVRTNVVLISPASGPASGGQTVTIYGEHFTGATRVVFGNAAAASFHVDSDTQITAVTPAYAVGKAFVRVRTTAGGPCLREALAPSSRSSGESDTSGVAMYRRG